MSDTRSFCLRWIIFGALNWRPSIFRHARSVSGAIHVAVPLWEMNSQLLWRTECFRYALDNLSCDPKMSDRALVQIQPDPFVASLSKNLVSTMIGVSKS